MVSGSRSFAGASSATWASSLGMQDIEVGDHEVDEAFVIKGNDEEKVRDLFANPKIRQLIHGSGTGGGNPSVEEPAQEDLFLQRCGNAQREQQQRKPGCPVNVHHDGRQDWTTD